jgi:long-chain acyl-CoA synthetase
MKNKEFEAIFNSNIDSGRTAIIDGKSSISYLRLRDKIKKLSKILESFTSSKSASICILLPNGIENIICYYSINYLNIICVPIDFNSSMNNIEQITNHSDASLIVTDYSKINSIPKSFSEIKSVANDEFLKIKIFKKAINKNNAKHYQSSDVSLLIYTTGTTGDKKGVMLTDKGVLAATKSINKVMNIPLNTIEVIAMPLSRSFGLARMRCVFNRHGTIILTDGLKNPALFLKIIIDYSVIGFGLVPDGMRILLSKFSKYLKDLSSQIQYIEMGSAEFGEKEKVELQEMMPYTDITMHYGLTEASRSTFLNFKELTKLKSVGKPAPGATIKICDKNNKNIGIDKVGKIHISSPWLAKGYLNKSGDFNGEWLITDDLGSIDKDGYLYYLSRESDVIEHQGYKFSPIEIESVLNENKYINESCVIIAEDPIKCIIAFITLTGANETFKDNLKSFCSDKLEVYKIPSRFLICENIEKTDSGKIKRKLMREKYFG